jgi:HK97 family phage portal protein
MDEQSQMKMAKLETAVEMMTKNAEATNAEKKQGKIDAVIEGHKPPIWLAGQYKTMVGIPGWSRPDDMGRAASLYSTSPWAKACIDLRANALAQIGWGIFDDQDEELEKHPLIDLLNRVDMEQNWNDLIRATVCDMLIFGQAFWQKVYGRGQSGNIEGSVPIRLKRLNAGTMEVDAGRDGIIGFIQQLEGGRTPFKRGEVVFFRDFNPDNDLGGLASADVVKAAIQIENYADRYLTSFFQEHAVPDVVYSTEQELADEDYSRLQRWFKKFKGVDNQHKSAIMEKGVKATVISFPLSDLALDTVRLEARRSICAGLGVPMSMIGADPSANFATADNERKSLYTEHVIPQSEYLASVINAELVADFDQSLTFEWKSDELPIMQPDAKSEAERLSMLVEKGIIKPEVAALELGFSEEDVPEAAPEQPNPFGPQPGVTPPALEPFANATEQIGQGEQPEQPQKAVDEMATDLRRWCKKAVARRKAGKSAAVKFESEFIKPELIEAILGQLDDALTADDVRAVFDKVITWRGYP